MTYKYMKLRTFNQADVGTKPLYIFPLPHGQRALIKTNGTSISVSAIDPEDVGDLTGYAPDLEERFKALYLDMMSEPDQNVTQDGVQIKFPALYFDVILSDVSKTIEWDGAAEMLSPDRLSDFFDFSDTAPAGSVRATVLSVVPESAYAAGKDRYDLWWRRSWLMRGLSRIGMANRYAFPRCQIRALTQTPPDWAAEHTAVCQDDPRRTWDVLYNSWANGHRAALIVDVWQPWAVSGDAFRVLTEDEVEL